MIYVIIIQINEGVIDVARGRTAGPKTLDEKIDLLKQKIAEKTNELQQLKNNLKAVEKQKESENLQKLYAALKKADLSVDEVLEKIQQA